MAKRNNNTRRNNRRGGRRNLNTRKTRNGIFSKLYSPLGEGVNTLKNVTGTGLNLIVNVPTNALKGVKGVAKGVVYRVANDINKVGKRTTVGVNAAFSSLLKSRKNSRKSRKASRKASRKSRRANMHMPKMMH